jgi:uncharacterized membrane protein YphA (DoxX/SURF4 family)
MIKKTSLSLAMLFRILLGCTFIFSGLSKLFPIHLTELNLVYHHIANWSISPYLTRLLILLEITLGLALIFGIHLKKITIPISLFFTAIFSIYLLLLLFHDGNNQNCGCFGSVVPMTPLQSLLKNALIIVVLILLRNKSAFVQTKLKMGLFISFTAIFVITLLFYFPIYTWLDVNPKPNKTVPFQFIEKIKMNKGIEVDLTKGKKLIGVFNMACDHCHEVAFKFGILAKENNLQNVYLILVGEQDEIAIFLSETHLNYPYIRYNFFEIVEKYPNITWPWIIDTENGKIKKQWIYETFDVKNFMLQLK